MLPCYLRCVLAMLLDRLCGELNIIPGKWVNVFDTPTIADTVSSNHVPWTVAGVCYLMCVVLLFSIRVLLARENKRRDAELRDDRFDDVGTESVLRSRSPRFVPILTEKLVIFCDSMNRSSWI